MSPSNIKIMLLFGMTIFFWSSSLVAIRIALQSYDPVSLALFRYLIASFGMLFVYWNVSHKRAVDWRDIPIIFFAGVVGFAVYNIALNYGEVTVSAGVSGFIVSQIPVVIAFLAIIFLGERLSKKAWLGMCISIIGVGLIAASHHSEGVVDIGIFYLLIAVISAGIYHAAYKYLLRKYHAVELTAYGIWGGTLSMLFHAPTLWQEIPTATIDATLSVIYLGIFPGLIGYLSWSYALRHVPASKAASAFYVMPIVTAFLGWICLGEIPPWLALIGGLTALVGAIIVGKAKVGAKVVDKSA